MRDGGGSDGQEPFGGAAGSLPAVSAARVEWYDLRDDDDDDDTEVDAGDGDDDDGDISPWNDIIATFLQGGQGDFATQGGRTTCCAAVGPQAQDDRGRQAAAGFHAENGATNGDKPEAAFGGTNEKAQATQQGAASLVGGQGGEGKGKRQGRRQRKRKRKEQRLGKEVNAVPSVVPQVQTVEKVVEMPQTQEGGQAGSKEDGRVLCSSEDCCEGVCSGCVENLFPGVRTCGEHRHQGGEKQGGLLGSDGARHAPVPGPADDAPQLYEIRKDIYAQAFSLAPGELKHMDAQRFFDTVIGTQIGAAVDPGIGVVGSKQVAIPWGSECDRPAPGNARHRDIHAAPMLGVSGGGTVKGAPVVETKTIGTKIEAAVDLGTAAGGSKVVGNGGGAEMGAPGVETNEAQTPAYGGPVIVGQIGDAVNLGTTVVGDPGGQCAIVPPQGALRQGAAWSPLLEAGVAVNDLPAMKARLKELEGRLEGDMPQGDITRLLSSLWSVVVARAAEAQ